MTLQQRGRPMSTAARPNAAVEATPRFGSDCIADLLRALGIEYIALTPGASFRGLHDSLVNYLGNERPELLLCVHEEACDRARARLRARHRASAGGRAACQRRPDARDDGDLQRVVRPHSDADDRRRRSGRRRAAPAVGRLDPHRGRSGGAGARLHQVGRRAGIGRRGAGVDVARAPHRDDGAARRRCTCASTRRCRKRRSRRRRRCRRWRAFPAARTGRCAGGGGRRDRRAAGGGETSADPDRARGERPRRVRAPRRARRARQCARAYRPEDRRELSHGASAAPVRRRPLRQRRSRRDDARSGRDPESRLDRPRRIAAPGLRRTVPGGEDRAVLAGFVFAQGLEHGLPVAAAGGRAGARQSRSAGGRAGGAHCRRERAPRLR